jgi:KDO2-lipid IV(A) lauroyltransferase
MGTKAFFTKSGPTRLGYYIAKWVPPFLGYMIAGTLARMTVWIKPDIYWTSMDNFSHIYRDYTKQELHRIVYKQIYNSIRFYYDLFHNIGRGRRHLKHFKPPVRISSSAKQYIEDALTAERGLLFLGCHMANFDLGGIGLSQFLPKPGQALSLASPPSGFEFINRLRAVGYGTITPINAISLRESINRLKSGGVVLTGVDRPISKGNEPVMFFGDTAYLPKGYIRIALLSNCLVMTISFFYEDNYYWIDSNPAMEMVRTGDRKKDIDLNVQRVLAQIEDFIRRDPTQWMMFLPVWPKMRGKVSV